MDRWSYTEREGCDYISLRVDYERGDRTYYYEVHGALVGVVADNAFANGFAVCGLVPSCTGAVVRQCRLCRGSAVSDDSMPDCPATLWGN